MPKAKALLDSAKKLLVQRMNGQDKPILRTRKVVSDSFANSQQIYDSSSRTQAASIAI